MKRTFDILTSLFVLILFVPFGVVISIFILTTSKGGIFYKQERIGYKGEPFKLFKFRTMKVNAEASGQLTVGMRDPRITSVGYFLRKSKLDEFPQFINVLIGQMSVVGPRPEVQKYVEMYDDSQRFVFDGALRPSAFITEHTLHLVDGVKMHAHHSFPSGHTTVAFAFFGFAALFLARKKAGLQVIFAACAGLVGYSRMYLSQHFLEDVFAGMLLGSIWIVVLALFFQKKLN